LAHATEHYFARAKVLFLQTGKRPPTFDLRFDLRGKAAGQFVRQGRRYTIRYNLEMAAAQPEAFIKETVPHETAHLVTAICHPRAKPHGREWRAVMNHFGIEQPQRCHLFDTQKTQSHSQRRWPYRCHCGDHQLSSTRHFRVLRNEQSYICLRCKQPLVYSP
jgi:SprT protein